MKYRRKYRRCERVDSVAELLEHDWFIVHFGHHTKKTMHKDVLREWKLKTCQQAIDSGRIFIAARLTNGEYYAGMRDDELFDMLETDVCEFCEGKQTIIGACEGRWCDQALAAWKEEMVK